MSNENDLNDHFPSENNLLIDAKWKRIHFERSAAPNSKKGFMYCLFVFSCVFTLTMHTFRLLSFSPVQLHHMGARGGDNTMNKNKIQYKI